MLFPEKHLICLFFCFADYAKVGVSLLQNDRFSTFYLFFHFPFFIFPFSKESESAVFVIYLRQAGLAGRNIVLS